MRLEEGLQGKARSSLYSRRFIFASTPVALKNKLTYRHTSFSVIMVTGELLFNDL